LVVPYALVDMDAMCLAIKPFLVPSDAARRPQMVTDFLAHSDGPAAGALGAVLQFLVRGRFEAIVNQRLQCEADFVQQREGQPWRLSRAGRELVVMQNVGAGGTFTEVRGGRKNEKAY
jgi:hypothetical protein